MFNKTDRYQDYTPISVKGCDSKKIEFCRTGRPQECQYEPSFVKEMDSSLFKQIEGVVDNNRNQYLLLFNISGRPKICLTNEVGPLSEEVRQL